MGGANRLALGVAATAVGFAAADTYVVVLALPDMMSSVGLNLDQLQRAAPIVSGFLLGYIAVLPLIGRIADLRGRIPVLTGSLVVFSLGSLVTAASYDLTTMVAGRFIQGVGGGGLVPATLALVADIWTVERRGVPLGVVGAVQELGSVLGPLYGALVLAVSTWHTIFWLNLAIGVLLTGALVLPPGPRERSAGSQSADNGPAHGRPAARRAAGRSWDCLGALLGVAAVGTLALVMVAPHRLTTGLTTGLAYVPYFGDSRWSTPMAFAGYALVGLLLVRQLTARHPLVDLRATRALTSSADLLGAALLGVALGGVVLAFATGNPEVQVFSRLGESFLLVSATATVLFVWRQRKAATPLIPRGALTARPAWAAVLISLFVGSSLIAALVDVPVFARVTTYRDSQLGAALVLVRLLAALPLGALAGGYLLRYVPVGFLAAGGMTLAGAGFVWMSSWDLHALESWLSTVPLVMCGLGFGLAIAPVNAALLAATRAEVHGVSSALLVVARMVGMLVGISALTTIGLRRFYAVSDSIPPIAKVCPSPRICDAYVLRLKEAGLVQLQAIFLGAGVLAAVAVLLCVLLLRKAPAAIERRPGGYGL